MSNKTSHEGLRMLKLAFFEFFIIKELHHAQVEALQADSQEFRAKLDNAEVITQDMQQSQ